MNVISLLKSQNKHEVPTVTTWRFYNRTTQIQMASIFPMNYIPWTKTIFNWFIHTFFNRNVKKKCWTLFHRIRWCTPQTNKKQFHKCIESNIIRTKTSLNFVWIFIQSFWISRWDSSTKLKYIWFVLLMYLFLWNCNRRFFWKSLPENLIYFNFNLFISINWLSEIWMEYKSMVSKRKKKHLPNHLTSFSIFSIFLKRQSNERMIQMYLWNDDTFSVVVTMTKWKLDKKK